MLKKFAIRIISGLAIGDILRRLSMNITPDSSISSKVFDDVDVRVLSSDDKKIAYYLPFNAIYISQDLKDNKSVLYHEYQHHKDRYYLIYGPPIVAMSAISLFTRRSLIIPLFFALNVGSKFLIDSISERRADIYACKISTVDELQKYLKFFKGFDPIKEKIFRVHPKLTDRISQVEKYIAQKS